MSDLTKEEQTHVRTALKFLRSRCGGIVPLAKVLHSTTETLNQMLYKRDVTASMAFRVARLAQVTVDDLLMGKYPDPRACPHCGHVPALA